MGAMGNCRFNQGFSIFEILIVMFIIAMVAGLGVPRFQSSLEKAEIRASAGKIASAIRASRLMSVSEKIPLTVILDGENRKVFAVRDADRESGETEVAITPVELIPENVTLWQGGEQVVKAYVNFHPVGASSGGLFYVIPSGAGQSENGAGWIISIDPISGRVKLTSVKSGRGEAG